MMEAQNTRAGSSCDYDCQWVFNGMRSIAVGAGNLLKWSVDSMTPYVPDKMQRIVKTAFEDVRRNIPQSISNFSQAVKSDVNWLFNDPSQEGPLGQSGGENRSMHESKSSLKGSQAEESEGTSMPAGDSKSSLKGSQAEESEGSSMSAGESKSSSKVEGSVRSNAEARRCAQRVVLVAFSLIFCVLYKQVR